MTPQDRAPVAPPHAFSVVQAASLLRRGDLRAETYAGALLARCHSGTALNVFISLDDEALLSAARDADIARSAGRAIGLLHGIPLAFKDNIQTLGLPTTGGTASLIGMRSHRNAAVADRLHAQGALLLGKNGMHELAMGWTSDNPHFGRVGNPHAPERLAGGSSGGSAAAVAAWMAPAAIGTDTNGSIRIPSALCGVAGFRPTVGRYPTEGVVPLSPTLDTVGPIARSAGDLALLDAIMAGQPPAQPRFDLDGVRIAVSPRYYLERLEQEVARVFDDARACLASQGAQIVDADIPGLEGLVADLAPSLIRHESASALPAWLAAHGSGVSMDGLIAGAGRDLFPALSAGQRERGSAQAMQNYHVALQRRATLSAAMQRYFAEHRVDVLMYPVVRVSAPLATTGNARVSPAPDVPMPDGSTMSAREAFGQNVSPASIAALPSLVLNAGFTSAGLPVGIAFDAPHGGDSRLLSLGVAIERAFNLVPQAIP